MRLLLTMRTVAADGLGIAASTRAAGTIGAIAAGPLIMVGNFTSLAPEELGAGGTAAGGSGFFGSETAGAGSVLGAGDGGRGVSGGEARTTLVGDRSPSKSGPGGSEATFSSASKSASRRAPFRW